MIVLYRKKALKTAKALIVKKGNKLHFAVLNHFLCFEICNEVSDESKKQTKKTFCPEKLLLLGPVSETTGKNKTQG